MVADFVDIALSFFHLVGAFIWIGTTLYTGVIFTPVFNKLEPHVRETIIRNLVPRQSNILIIALILTGLTGLLRTFRSPMYSYFVTDPWGWGILLGGGAAALMALISFLVIIPSGKKLLELSTAGSPESSEFHLKNPSSQLPEIAKLQTRIVNASMINFVLSFVVIFGMAVAG